MPKTTVIDIEPTTRTGLRGRLDKLLAEFTMKAQAIKITAQILDEEDHKLALANAPQKFLHAVNTRNGHAGRAPVDVTPTGRRKNMSKADRAQLIVQALQRQPGMTTAELAEAVHTSPNNILNVARKVAKPSATGPKGQLSWTLKGKHTHSNGNGHAPMPRQRGKGRFRTTNGSGSVIHGQALSLFVLEHLSEEKPVAHGEVMQALATAGSPMKNGKALNGINASLARFGYMHKTRDGGFLATVKGVAYAQQLRSALEAKGTIASGGYLSA